MRTLQRVALSCCLVLAIPGWAQDVVTVGSTSGAPGSRVSIPVSVRDVSGTALGTDAPAGSKIQSFGVRVLIAPAGAATDVTFTSGGVLASLTPLYQQQVGAADSIAWVGVFPESSTPVPFVANGSAPGSRIGAIDFTINPALADGTQIALSLHAATTLGNQAGTIGETVGDGLQLVNGSVRVGGTPTSVAIASSKNPSAPGESVTFTATVTAAAGGGAGGSIVFETDGAAPVIRPVVNGIATWSTSALPTGTHAITARYDGTLFLQQSTGAIQQVVSANAVAIPSNVIATANATSSVTVTWLPSSGAASYEVMRRTSIANVWSLAGATAGTTFHDSAVTAGVTYLYAVRAVTSGGVRSNESAADAASTIPFTDASLAGKTIERVHLTELRAAVNAFRSAAGLAAFAFTDHPLPASTKTRRIHVDQLRQALGEAYSVLGMPIAPYTDPALAGVRVKAIHFEQLRTRIR